MNVALNERVLGKGAFGVAAKKDFGDPRATHVTELKKRRSVWWKDKRQEIAQKQTGDKAGLERARPSRAVHIGIHAKQRVANGQSSLYMLWAPFLVPRQENADKRSGSAV
jgi:hypothetical protein